MDAERGRCEAYKPTLGGGQKQCPRPAQYDRWCHFHARSVGGWRLAPPLAAPAVTETADLRAVGLTARALHRWRHPTYRLGEQGCRCRADAEMAVEIVEAERAALAGTSDTEEPEDG